MSVSPRSWRSWPWSFLIAPLLLLAVMTVMTRVSNLEALADSLHRARGGPLLFALGLQGATLLNQVGLYRSLYRLVGLEIEWRALAPLVWAGHFLNAATPSAGLGGTALLLADGRRRGFDAGRVSLANTLFFGLNFAVFALLLAGALGWLFLRRQLDSAEIAASLLLLGVLSLGAAGLSSIAWWPQHFERVLGRITRGVNAVSRVFTRREALSSAATLDFARGFADAIRALTSAKTRVLRPMFHAVLVDGLEVLTLGACLRAFAGRESLAPAALVAVYAVGTLFLVVSITPQGLGVVEGVMTAVLVTLGVPLERAALVVLTYRGLSFWLPFGVGFVASKRALGDLIMNSALLSNPNSTFEAEKPGVDEETAADTAPMAVPSAATSSAATSSAATSSAATSSAATSSAATSSAATSSAATSSAATSSAATSSAATSSAATSSAATSSAATSSAATSSAATSSAATSSAATSSAAMRRGRHSIWTVRLPALAIAAMGLLNVWSAVTPGLPERLQLLWDTLPFDARRGSHLAAALLGFALLVLAQGLWRRKSVSWALALGALLISAFAHLFKGLDYEEAGVALGLMAWLWSARRGFHARSDKPSMRRGLQILGLAFVFTMGYGTLGFYLLDDFFRVHFDLLAAVRQTVTMFVSFSDPGLEPTRGFGRDFADSIYLVATGTFGFALFSLLRPLVQRGAASDAERTEIAPIVEQYGRTAFAFCALLPDKSYWISSGGSVVAYALVGRVAVAMGDPIGPLDDTPDAIQGFCDFCRQNDWRPAFYEVYDEFLDAHHAAGLRGHRIAHEAIVDVQKWTLAGGENKGLRAQINYATKQGLRSKLHEAPQSDAFLAELRAVSDAWLSERGGSEKAFSLGWFDEETLRHQPIMAIHDADGAVVAFANIVPCYTAPEATIDLMRRVADTPKGTMEMLFTALFEWTKSQNLASFNLGASPFALVGEHDDDPATEKAIHFIYEHIDHFYNFKGLYSFKEKFRPRWRPLFLSCEGTTSLPLVAAAIVRADSGQSSWWDFIRTLRGERS